MNTPAHEINLRDKSGFWSFFPVMVCTVESVCKLWEKREVNRGVGVVAAWAAPTHTFPLSQLFFSPHPLCSVVEFASRGTSGRSCVAWTGCPSNIAIMHGPRKLSGNLDRV